MIFCFFSSCVDENKIEKEVAKIPVEFEVERFDQLFAKAKEEDLPNLKQKFPFLFPEKYPDSIWIQRTKDTIQQELNVEVAKAFPDFIHEKKDLSLLLQHVKYYFPEVTMPRVVTVTSDVDYRNKIILSDDLLLISLDTYLGSEHHFYESIQAFLRENFTKEQLMPDIATTYAKQLVELPVDRTFLAHLIYYGKILYLKDLFLPEVSMAQKIGYSEDQLSWIEANEEQIWRYFIDRQVLYDTDPELMPRFLLPAPFSKFYLEQIDQEAPGRVGQYIGWRIVDSYMKNNKVSLRQLLMIDAETIFNRSKYKPR